MLIVITAVVSELCIHVHGKIVFAENLLCMDEVHQGVGRDVAVIVQCHCVWLRDGGRTTNRYLGAISPMSRYVRELEARLMKDQKKNMWHGK